MYPIQSTQSQYNLNALDSKYIESKTYQCIVFEYIHGSKVEILQLKVMLKGAKLPAWPRLLIRSNLTLAEFHRVLQVSFEWTDSHLYEFRVGGYNGTAYGLVGPEFDFGEPMPLDQAAGPAEDRGGLWGWESMVEAVSNPSHEEHSEYRGRLGLKRVKRLIPRALTRTEWTRSFPRGSEESTTTALAFQPQLACRYW